MVCNPTFSAFLNLSFEKGQKEKRLVFCAIKAAANVYDHRLWNLGTTVDKNQKPHCYIPHWSVVSPVHIAMLLITSPERSLISNWEKVSTGKEPWKIQALLAHSWEHLASNSTKRCVLLRRKTEDLPRNSMSLGLEKESFTLERQFQEHLAH